ncbi:MAG TPA: quinone-dependent dihydroorotate dehydrogenase [Myxococcaceae bacterium]|nr:quinone-dependent dihydroorotate dehydrogenase [Myxococcaceae bacterium]
MYRFLRTLLFLLPPERAHALGMGLLALLGRWPWLCRTLRRRALTLPARAPPVDLTIRTAGLTLAHPLALAAGLDKDGHAVAGLFALGFAAVEVGTVTPRPQAGNPRPRLYRLPEHGALINRLGFNNAGAEAAAARLRKGPWRPGPLGVNVGKNRDTLLEAAADDYLACTAALAPLADYLVVNASSPNTPGLRQLQEPERLAALLRAVRARLGAVAPGTPLLLKIAPDLGEEAVDAVVDVALDAGADGLIATNTSVTRPFAHPLARQEGGLSGRPLRALAASTLRRASRRADGRLALWGAGGVATAEDVYKRVRAGASVVQLYTALVFEGPGLVGRLLSGLAELLRRDGFSRVEDAVGADAGRRRAAGGG